MARDASRPDAPRRQRRAGAVKDAVGTAKRREPKATVLDRSEHRGTFSCTDYVPQLQEDSFYRIHIGGPNLLCLPNTYSESAGPFMRRFPSRAGPFMRGRSSLSGTVYA